MRSPQVTMRPARPDERRALEALQLRASLVWEDYREQLLVDPGIVQIPDWHLAHTEVAEVGGTMAGFVVVLPGEAGTAELDGLFVEPDRWGVGVGRALAAAAERMARALGARDLHVVANPRAEGFYAACGFVAAGEAQTELGTAPAMRKRIDD